MNVPLLSKCCAEPLVVSEGEEGTSCYVCTFCRLPTDPAPEPDTYATGTKKRK
jgi:hypothetical protein